MSRSPFHGTRQILRFNWPFYALALGAMATLGAVLRARRWPLGLEFAARGSVALGAWWSVASVAVSWWIYDASPLYHWAWLRPFFAHNPRRWATFHAGVDDATPALRQLWGSDGAAYDFYDAHLMTEPSIGRARAVSRPEVVPTPVDFRALPLPNNSLDAAFVMLAAHELRDPGDRQIFWGELYRVLAPGGVLVVAEHARDGANFLAFGPGAFHFFAPSQWRELGAAFQLQSEFKITPFVRVWVWKK